MRSRLALGGLVALAAAVVAFAVAPTSSGAGGAFGPPVKVTISIDCRKTPFC